MTAKKKTAKRKAGRPRVHVLDDRDEKKLLDLASIGCTNDEIEALMGMSWDTIARKYADIIKTGRAEVRMSLRRKQLQMAMEGNVGMLVWLGKQMLGQKEPDRKITAGVGTGDPDGEEAPAEFHLTLRVGDKEIAMA